jgi:hypothetical protein
VQLQNRSYIYLKKLKKELEIISSKHTNFKVLFNLKDILSKLKGHTEIIEKLMRNRWNF